MAAGGCDWTFRARGPSRSQVSCVIRLSRNANSSLPTDPASDIAQLRSRVERDVAITIGPERNKKREKISLELFKQWLEISLDIRGFSYPSYIIKTGVGDIILDEKFRGKVYLKGVLLSGSSLETSSYKLSETYHAKVSTTIGPFINPEIDSEQDVDVIRDVLGKEPVKIPESLWDLIRSDSAIRTAEEEQIILFKNAPVCSPSNSSFSMTVQRVLKACMALSENTKYIRVFFIHIHNSTIDTFFDLEQQVLKIHHRWLDFDATHRRYPYRDALPNIAGPYAPFFCDHIIEELIRKALPIIFRAAPISRTTKNGVIRQIRYRLRHTLCGCLEQLVSQRHKVAVFADLDCSKKYFPIIALNQRLAFYGYPPETTVRGGQVEARDPAVSLSIHEQQKADTQTFPSRTQHGPQEPAAPPPHAQQPHLQAQQAQTSQMARELFIRQAKRQKH
ncbi:uncharacterized protein N7477_008999 [Penicillium maclennaniae]|uniref:uncharacterized protein n=1 Tax=Penicillium maclennaniae TaxID=1343394 RepID=UPI002540E629|nr:uncharacterized protein N7477_008999 [Penicillium maclennaniae]KAJ5666551.1 hypothetical protein N7477_008999 [Penicillium maclennaniae]